MTAEAERCREQVRLWRDPGFQPGRSSVDGFADDGKRSADGMLGDR
jgi:hypothetical protein